MVEISTLQSHVSASTEAKRSLIIACTLRSGSNLLCELMEKRGLGRPREYFQEQSYKNDLSFRVACSPNLPSLPEIYEAFAAAHDQNSWLSVKWNWAQFRTLNETIRRSEDSRSFDELFPRAAWIKLERQDKVAQAVSLFAAQETGVWVNGDAGRVQHNLQYDFERIYSILGEILREEFSWENFYRKSGIVPVTVVYEELARNPDAECARILRSLGIDVEDSQSPPESVASLLNQRTRTTLHEEYTERFYEDIANGRLPKKQMDFDGLLINLNKLYEKQAEEPTFASFLGDHTGRFPQIRKLNIDADCTLEGDILRKEEPHFLDGVGYRLDAGSQITFRVPARRMLLRLLAHQWSGEAELCFESHSRAVDLYHPVTSTRHVLEHWPETAPRTVTIRPRGVLNPLSWGTEVWLQQVWVLAD